MTGFPDTPESGAPYEPQPDFAQRPQAGDGRSGARIAMLVLLAVLLAAGIGSYFWWRAYTHSPQYSLTQLVRAAEKGDWAGVEKRLDTEAVAEDIADAALADALKNGQGELGQLGLLGNDFAKGIADTLKPRLIEEIQLQMQEQVERRSGNTKMFVGALLVANVPRRATVRGDTALVTVTVPYRGGQIDLDLTMQRLPDDTWQVVGVRNAEEIVRRFSAGG